MKEREHLVTITLHHVHCDILISSETICSVGQAYHNTLRAMAKHSSELVGLRANIRYMQGQLILKVFREL